MKTLELQENQVELDSILDQRKRLDEAYERQSQWLEERECAIKKEIKALSPSASETLKDKAKKAVEGVGCGRDLRHRRPKDGIPKLLQAASPTDRTRELCRPQRFPHTGAGTRHLRAGFVSRWHLRH